MSLKTALQSAALRLVGRKPTAFAASSALLEAELVDLANEVAQDCAGFHDWRALVRVFDVPADGVLTEFDLPADYLRQVASTRVRDNVNMLGAYGAAASIDDFLSLQGRGGLLHGAWLIMGRKLQFTTAPQASTTLLMSYISKNYAIDDSGATKARFDNDADEFALPERLLTLGVIWRWRENKKLDYTGDQEAFANALEEYSADDGGTQRIVQRSRVFDRAPVAWPWPLGGV